MAKTTWRKAILILIKVQLGASQMSYLTLAGAAALLASLFAVASAAADGRDTCNLAKGDDAIVACSLWITQDPKYAVAYQNRGKAYISKGDYDHAIADFNQAIRLDPHSVNAYDRRGWAYYSKGDYDRAIADFDQAINIDPQYDPTHNNRGLAYEAKGDHDRAFAGFDQAIKLNPNGAVAAYNNRGRAYYAKGHRDLAMADFNEAIRLDPKYALAYRSRAAAYFDKGDFDRSIADYDEAITLEPEYGPNYNNRGRAYAAKGDYDRAFAGYDQAIRLNPNGAFAAYSNRGYAHDVKGDHDRAIDDFDQAITLNPKFAIAYQGRGAAYLGKGEYERAIADYDRALELDPRLTAARQGRERARVALAARPARAKPPASQAASPSAASERRVALVIGNSAYRSVALLPNPRRDVKAVADALRGTGFQTVELVDLDRDAMVKALRAFRTMADKADWAVIYFAGHGIEINRVNYLIPIDARLADDRDVKIETVSFEELLSTVSGARMLRLIILDACRVNPFEASMRRSGASRGGADRGLAPPPETEAGTLVVYSAKDGEVAADDVGGVNSPFASAFVSELKVPGREVRRLFDYVRDDVVDATKKHQQPFTYGSLPGRRDFYFVPGR
jgi:tetratricopeptide (TPR) repeat protein